MSSEASVQIHNRVKREENNRNILSSLPSLPHSNLRKNDKKQKSYYEVENEDAYETISASHNVINKELNDTKTQITVSEEERVKSEDLKNQNKPHSHYEIENVEDINEE